MRARAKSEIPYNQRRLLGLPEFASYTSLGKDQSIKLANISGAIVKVGRRTLVDRETFDKWFEMQKHHVDLLQLDHNKEDENENH